jgi:hypothetical protein
VSGYRHASFVAVRSSYISETDICAPMQLIQPPPPICRGIFKHSRPYIDKAQRSFIIKIIDNGSLNTFIIAQVISL